MTIKAEKFSSLEEYCNTTQYQKWLAQWKEPPGIDQWRDNEDGINRDWGTHYEITPRQHTATRYSTRIPFHLIDSLGIGQENTVDIGCGANWFAKIYPNVFGVDPHGIEKDELLTPDWWVNNWNKWPHAFAINSMHFFTQSQIIPQLEKVVGILKPDGTALVTLNRQRIKDCTDTDYNEKNLLTDLENYNKITRLLWIDYPHCASLDGNIWIYLKK